MLYDCVGFTIKIFVIEVDISSSAKNMKISQREDLAWLLKLLGKLDVPGSPWGDSGAIGVVCCVDPGAEDEGGSHRKNHVVEAHRALDREVTESPYLAC